MATYNAEAYVAAAVESVLAQTYANVELVVVDDCSSDATPDVVATYQRAYPDRIRLIRKPQREGPCRARNDALSVTHGPLIAWLDNDDLWTPDKLMSQVRLFEERLDVGLVYSYFDAFDSASGATLPWSDGRRDHEGDVLAQLVVEGCFIGSLTAVFRREALDARGGRLRDRDFSFGDDYDLWLRIALDWRVARVPRVLARYRRHAANESDRLALDNADLRRVELLRDFLAYNPDALRRLGRSWRVGLARHLMLAARFDQAHDQATRAGELKREALQLDPLCRVRELMRRHAARWG